MGIISYNFQAAGTQSALTPSLNGNAPFGTVAASSTHNAPAATLSEAFQTRRYHSAKMRRLWVLVSILGDSVVALAASILAFWIRFHTFKNVGPETDIEGLRQYLSYFVLGSLWFVGILAWLGVYHSSVLLQSRVITSKILKGSVIWTISFLAVMFAFQFHPAISRLYTVIDGACSLAFLLMWRSILNSALFSPENLGILRQRTLVVGWNDAAQRLVQSFNEDEGVAYEIIGWADGAATVLPDGRTAVPHLGSVSDIEHIIESNNVDMVVLTELSSTNDETYQLATVCEREMIQFKIVPSCFRIFVSGLHVETTAGTPMIGVDRLPLDSVFNLVFKRALDVLGAIVGLTLFTPVIAVFGALVWLESRGPIFYRQRRCGLNGKTFDIIKIRSMRLDAEKNGAQWSTGDGDPRCLRIGALMRKWSVDELPQFWNVLKGEMSLVGPRPERPELIRNFKHQIPHYNARHMGKPGVTGWSQIHDSRRQENLVERIRCDIWYLENWNLLLDLEIMFLTVAKLGKQ